ncbi:MAG: hypothetical protein B7Z39_02110 [Novosphingobium sp. 12-64-8]|nr:MAG: hypothetical protein B7Z39_02110 [Novosphingobium sp. 12-64-8]
MKDPRIAEADRALAARDPARARALMEAAAKQSVFGLDEWRKLASLRRASGDLAGALAATRRALTISPLDFFSLLSKGAILEQMGDPGHGEVFGQALAQQPAGGLPDALKAIVAHAEAVYRGYQESLERDLAVAADQALAALSPLHRRHAERFISNTTRRTRPFRSEPTHFHYPGLLEDEFHDRAAFPWLARWEALTDAIAEEFATVVAAESAELLPYLNYSEDQPLAQWRALNKSREWTAIHLVQRGKVVEANARHCPRTMAFLHEVPQPNIAGCGGNAMFSLLAARTRIPPHVGVANFRLVAHLPLVVPSDCWFRVGETTRPWQRGEAFVFDDTIEHEAANDSDELRVVLIIDCWHPGLSEAERAAVSAIVAASPIVAGGL